MRCASPHSSRSARADFEMAQHKGLETWIRKKKFATACNTLMPGPGAGSIPDGRTSGKREGLCKLCSHPSGSSAERTWRSIAHLLGVCQIGAEHQSWAELRKVLAELHQNCTDTKFASDVAKLGKPRPTPI